jgi:streptogramin lyase
MGLSSEINLSLVNNTTLAQTINIMGSVTPQGFANNSNDLYEYDLSSDSFTNLSSVTILIATSPDPTFVAYTAPVQSDNVEGIVYALNTLNKGIFQNSGDIVYVSGSDYSYSNLVVNSSTSSSIILGTTGLNPIGITIDSAGNIYTINNTDNNITKITPFGVSTTLASIGVNSKGITIDSAGNLYTPSFASSSVKKTTPSGSTSYIVSTGANPSAITIDSLGNIYTANFIGNNITKITPLGVATSYGSLVSSTPIGMVVDSNGNVFVVASIDTVRKITPSGVSTNFGVFTLGNLTSIAIDSSDNIYVSDYSNQIIYKLTPLAVQTTYGTSTSNPTDIAIDSLDNIYCINQNDTVDKILSTGGTITISDLSVYSGSLSAIIVDSFFNVYVTDNTNNDVYKITP